MGQCVSKRRHIQKYTSYLPAYEDGTVCSETSAYTKVYFIPTCLWRWDSVFRNVGIYKSILHTYLPMKMGQNVPKRRHIQKYTSYLPAYEDGTVCSETSAYTKVCFIPTCLWRWDSVFRNVGIYKSILHTYLPMKMGQCVPKRRHIQKYTSYLPAYEDGTECFETSAHKIQTPENYPKHTTFKTRRKFEIKNMSCLSVSPSVLMKKRRSHGTDFHEIWYSNILRKSIEKIQVSLKSDKNNGHRTWRLYTVMIISRSLFVEWDKSCRESQNTHFS